jgi:hypothetical protein
MASAPLHLIAKFQRGVSNMTLWRCSHFFCRRFWSQFFLTLPPADAERFCSSSRRSRAPRDSTKKADLSAIFDVTKADIKEELESAEAVAKRAEKVQKRFVRFFFFLRPPALRSARVLSAR